MKKYHVNWDEQTDEDCGILVEAVCRYCNLPRKSYDHIELETILAILGIVEDEEDDEPDAEKEGGRQDGKPV